MSAVQTDTYYLLGILLRFLARSPETGDTFSLVEATVAPGAGPPLNRHPDDDESFYVLEGTFEFILEGSARLVSTGSFVKVPRGAVHAFTNVSDAPARMLIINVPGKVHDTFFSEAGRPMPPGTRELPPPDGEAPDIPRLIEIGQRAGIEFVLPKEAAAE
ncbi:cupin domain-containing protein [Rhizobium sp. BK251]|uniref:cupin domain-containing protein n=1 Tax=Rhizobium sp. BK251 TaxID=2512125 RepID=UPI001047E741|nr:cupin domain-containing protein [Rhizobium sp. BK251]TCL74617.1 quercetin dioxygenase-like cupin family protein [Rhizobium sp. BK251]